MGSYVICATKLRYFTSRTRKSKKPVPQVYVTTILDHLVTLSPRITGGRTHDLPVLRTMLNRITSLELLSKLGNAAKLGIEVKQYVNSNYATTPGIQ